MTAEEFTRARDILASSEVELIDELGVSPAVLHAWAAGTARIPERHARKIRWMADLEERDAALRASGLPECEWLSRRSAETPPDADLLRHLEVTQRHIATCPVCIARDRYVDERFGPPAAYPMSGLGRFFAWLMGLPAWMRPAIWGALIVGAAVIVRIVLLFPQMIADPRRLAEPLGAIVAAMVAGACGGIAYSLTQPTLVKLGRAGDYLLGIVCMWAYMGAVALIVTLASDERIIEERGGAVIFLVLSTVFGVVIGHTWFFRQRRDEAAVIREAGEAPAP